MKTFRKLNNLLGWLVFAISSWVYLSTVEPTASWWDCGEYILPRLNFRLAIRREHLFFCYWVVFLAYLLLAI